MQNCNRLSQCSVSGEVYVQEKKLPTDKALNRWMNQFKETGIVEKQKSTGRTIHLGLFKL